MAATSRMMPVIVASGRVIVRATAKLRSVASSGGDDRGHRELGVDRAQESQLLGARAEDQRHRRRRRVARDQRRRERQRQRHVLLGPQRHVAPVLRAADEIDQRRTVFRGQRRREDLAVHAERDLAAGDLLQLRRQRLVEQEADAERAEELGRVDAARLQHDRHGDQLQQPVGLRDEAESSRAPARHREPPAGWRRPLAACAAKPDRAEDLSRPARDEQQVRVELRRKVVDDVLDRRRIVGRHGGLELRRVGDDRAIIVNVCGARRPQLVRRARRSR